MLNRMNLTKALVCSDKGLIKVGTTKMVTDVLDAAGFPYEIYSEIKPNPTVTNVQQGVEAFKKSGANCIIAIGGGSSMDTAKGIGIVANNPEFANVVSLEGCAPTKHKSVPIIALPTTAGTGAEVTINYVIIDEKRQAKMVCVDPNDIPAVAIVDPELMYTLPKGLTAATGMDALTHAIEGYITKGAWVMSDMYELQAIKMIAENFDVQEMGTDIFKPTKLHEFSMYLDGKWYKMTAKNGTYNDNDPIGVLDVTILSNLVLDKVMGIKDLRTDKRIDFVGGIRGLGELKRRVDSGEMAVAFALYPVSMKQLIDIADSGNIMPPKTTWFEPKLRSGLVIHELE